jgi:Helix-turn-helix domain
MLEQLLTDIQAAAILGVSPVTLRKDRCQHGLGIPVIKIGKSVRYSPAALQQWVEGQKQAHTVAPQSIIANDKGKVRGRPTKASQIARDGSL